MKKANRCLFATVVFMLSIILFGLFGSNASADALVGSWNNVYYNTINHFHADHSVYAPTAGRGWDHGSWTRNSNGTVTIQFAQGRIELRPVSQDHMVEIGNNHDWYRVVNKKLSTKASAIIGSWNNVRFNTINHLSANHSVSAPTADNGWNSGRWQINPDGTVTIKFARGLIHLRPINFQLMKEIGSNGDWVRVK